VLPRTKPEAQLWPLRTGADVKTRTAPDTGTLLPVADLVA
jgi:hypothetical protein